ncbi:MAG: helix-turn-helix transcriptional regulator [Alistipes sp.]|nr:helix-turn-helix transcriptional regulator [Alistipes sp.]
MSVLEKTYLEEHGDEMLVAAGLSKVQFATKLGIAPQNVKKLFASKNISALAKVAGVLSVSLQYLIYGNMEQTSTDVHGCIYINGKPHLIAKKEDIEKLMQLL